MRRKILVYGDVNLNYRDGSGEWLIALTRCLMETNSDVHVLLKADVADSERLSELSDRAYLTVHTPFDDHRSGFAGMTPRDAARRIVVLDRRHRFDIVLTRGYMVAAHLAVSGRLSGRMWPYLTEGPAFRFRREPDESRLLDSIANESCRIFLQTEEARSVVEALNSAMTGKTLVMNPIVPDEAFRQLDHRVRSENPLSMVYAGKFARHWNTLEMTKLPESLSADGIEAHLHIVGDKFQNTGNDHSWLAEMKSAVAAFDPRVTWYGGLSRQKTIEIVAAADIGLCWRSTELDSSPEISTKMLECCALGTPPVLNRTAMHERLLGTDYPLFVENGDVQKTVRELVNDPCRVHRAREIAQLAVRPFSMTATVDRFNRYFERAEGSKISDIHLAFPSRKHRVVIAGHDFKFASDLIETLRQRSDVELRIDKWQRLAVHNQQSSLDAARWADTVICEWAGPNAVFYSKHLDPSKRLIVRFHGFEVRGSWIEDLNLTNVDAVVFISDFYRKYVLRRLGWPENKTTVIYNAIDIADLDRPKVDGAKFHIGLAGYVPFLKRPDRAVELLKLLLEVDDRFYLHLRGRAPWQYPWEWNKPAGRDAYQAFFRSIAESPDLREHIVFEPFSPDMGNWFRQIGWMLSPSSRETFHLAPMEGMASGAPALVWDREGAAEIFGQDFVGSGTNELVQFILSNLSDSNWQTLSREAKSRAAKYDLVNAREAWVSLLSQPPGSPPELCGTSILPVGSIPHNRAEALVLLYRTFEEEGPESALRVYREYFHWLETESSAVVGWRRLLEWVRLTGKNRCTPRPLYYPDPTVVIATGKARNSDFEGFKSTDTAAPNSCGSFDGDVLLTADRIAQVAMRDRAVAVVTGGPLGIVLASVLAAHRLGIPCYANEVEPKEAFGRTGLLFGEIYRNLKESVPRLSRLNEAVQPPFDRSARRTLSDLKIGLIADEFTQRTVSQAVPTIHLSRTNWNSEIPDVDAVLVESAWEGYRSEWFHGIAYHGEEEASDLWGLIGECRKLRIPVLFWNKEDPVHFNSFAKAAGQMDHVFTSDSNRMRAYLEQDNENLSVSSMPFFAQPTIHNPLPTRRGYSRTIAFAGTYYGKRYPKRSQELSMILESVARFGLTIYDRQKDRPDSPYSLPLALQQYSVGAVSYDDVLEVYKAHPIHINVNSVSDSPSMFSRRVVEIAASGSLVASGTGQGVREVLGTSFPILTSKKEWEKNVSLWMSDENERLRLVWSQMRTVFRSRRAEQALVYMLRTANIDVWVKEFPVVGWFINDESDLREARRQTFKPTVITTDARLAGLARTNNLAVVETAENIEWVGSPASDLVPTHLEDLLIATFFVKADLLSARSDLTADAPLISPGLGDAKGAIWKSNLEGPGESLAPWVWRFPFDNNNENLRSTTRAI